MLSGMPKSTCEIMIFYLVENGFKWRFFWHHLRCATVRVAVPAHSLHQKGRQATSLIDIVCHLLSCLIFSSASVLFVLIWLIASQLINILLCDLIIHHFSFCGLVILIEFSFLCKNSPELLWQLLNLRKSLPFVFFKASFADLWRRISARCSSKNFLL